MKVADRSTCYATNNTANNHLTTFLLQEMIDWADKVRVALFGAAHAVKFARSNSLWQIPPYKSEKWVTNQWMRLVLPHFVTRTFHHHHHHHSNLPTVNYHCA